MMIEKENFTPENYNLFSTDLHEIFVIHIQQCFIQYSSCHTIHGLANNSQLCGERKRIRKVLKYLK